MELTVNGTVQEGGVSDEAIAEAIQSLTGDVDSFAILAASEMSYIQTAGDPGTGFDLEYQNGSLKEHYYCTSGPLTAKQVVDAFQRYAKGDDRWQKDLGWKREDLAVPASPVPLKTVVVVAGLVVLLVAWWFSRSA
ncbi:MAG: hypothetical protein HKO62_09345 [Gammaproteobacteria bacterium]|nr:hypothetical protein [Gammaproteobacteria bacterium]